MQLTTLRIAADRPIRWAHEVTMKKYRIRTRIALLAATLTLMTVLVLSVADLMDIGPNLGLPVGYYGRFNRVLAQIHASPDIEVVRTTCIGIWNSRTSTSRSGTMIARFAYALKRRTQDRSASWSKS